MDTSPYGNARDSVYIYSKPDCIWPGISEKQEEEISLKVYPNPSSGLVKLEVPANNHQKHLLAIIYNLQGQSVFSQTLNPDNRELNFKLPNGVYLLNVISDEVTHTELITILN